MRDLPGLTAFVTGAASGIGFALAGAFAEESMNVMLADIEAPALESAVARLAAHAPRIASVVCDVSDHASVLRAAQLTAAAFGPVHILCNNAGVAGGSGIDSVSTETWRWVVDVNLMGVVHGVAAFLPDMRAAGQGGHIVNTASMAGLQANIGFSPYVATKYAVVGMSEGLAKDLAGEGIGVSVLCPGFVRTAISESARNRQASYGLAAKPAPGSKAAQLAAHHAANAADGLDPDVVAAQVLAAIRANEFYVFTHPALREEVDALCGNRCGFSARSHLIDEIAYAAAN
ncbi:MAG: SDR family NAD(P)-dependent oxidoreductase [Rhodoblastus sp.]|nr:SDR family NAD(P)-dependent oxidoreductase [Rhodoblastus sp.]